MGDDDAVDVALFGQGCNALAEGDEVLVGEALGSDLEDLLAAHGGHPGQLGHTGNQLVHRHLGCLVGGAVGGAGAGTGDGAAGGEDDDIGLVGEGRQGGEKAGGDQRAAG